MRGNVKNKNSSSVNIRFVAETSNINNFSENIRSDVKPPEVATLAYIERAFGRGGNQASAGAFETLTDANQNSCTLATKIKTHQRSAGLQPALHFGGVSNFHELSFDDVTVLIQPRCNFFANGHRYVLFAIFPKMRTY